MTLAHDPIVVSECKECATRNRVTVECCNCHIRSGEDPPKKVIKLHHEVGSFGIGETYELVEIESGRPELTDSRDNERSLGRVHFNTIERIRPRIEHRAIDTVLRTGHSEKPHTVGGFEVPFVHDATLMDVRCPETVVDRGCKLPRMRMVLNKLALGLLVAMLSVAAQACSSDTQDNEGEVGVQVVATTTMLGDVARNVVGDGGTVEVLLPIGADPHAFEPSSSQVSDIYGADLVIANGLGLEEGLADVLAAASADGVKVIEVGSLVDPVSFVDRQACDVDAARKCDPHVWLDPERDAQTAVLIGEALALIDTSIDWETRAAGYGTELLQADAAIARMLSIVPGPDRILITNHDSLGYFADRYGFDVIGSVVPGGSTVSEPSSADIAALVSVVNETGVKAIFTETTESTNLADAIAFEADHPVQVIPLFTGSLGPPGSDADTLIGMLETNADRVANGLS